MAVMQTLPTTLCIRATNEKGTTERVTKDTGPKHAQVPIFISLSTIYLVFDKLLK